MNDITTTDCMTTTPTNTTGSSSGSSGSSNIDSVIKSNRLRGLKPFVKGDSRINRKGKPKGTIQIKDVIRKRLNKINAKDIADNIISGSIAGDDKKQDRLLRLTGDLEEHPQVIVNTFTIPEEIMNLARDFAKENYITSSVATIDVINVDDNEITRAKEYLKSFN